ncbi:MAG TPA: hypothetical protein VFQ65_09360, partial [Kofleriaceae bacterium]|nr:hypothetical protein [Kofleriaceae bacterium]
MDYDDTADPDSLIRRVASAPPIAPPVVHAPAQPQAAAVPPVEDTAAAEDARAFALVRWGLRFARRETEAAYTAAQVSAMLRPIRIVS